MAHYVSLKSWDSVIKWVHEGPRSNHECRGYSLVGTEFTPANFDHKEGVEKLTYRITRNSWVDAPWDGQTHKGETNGPRYEVDAVTDDDKWYPLARFTSFHDAKVFCVGRESVKSTVAAGITAGIEV